MEHKIIISIGRQMGCGGRAVAAELGKILGIPVYDGALLEEAAKKTGYSPEIFHKRDEKRHLFSWSRLFSSTESNTPNYLADGALFQMQSEAIKDIAAKGSCVIVGRCADYVLRDEPGLLSVFLTSPLEKRIASVMERKDVDEQTAEKIIRTKERNRERYYNGYTLGKWGDASTYDLCLDITRLGVEGTAQFIVDFAKKLGLLG